MWRKKLSIRETMEVHAQRMIFSEIRGKHVGFILRPSLDMCYLERSSLDLADRQQDALSLKMCWLPSYIL